MYTTLIVFFIVAITISFLCSLWEAVLLSISPIYAKVKIQEGGYLGKRLQHFKENIEKPLAAILTLNTFAHTIGAIGVGAQASLIWKESNPAITVIFVPLIMTLAILILSEIIPKTIGANHWEKFAQFTIYSLSFLTKAMYPLVWLCQLITSSFRSNNSKSIFSRADFLTLTEIGEEQGVFNADEADLIEGSLDLHELRAIEVMRPLEHMVAISKTDTIQELVQCIKKHRYSRYPVYDKNKRDIIGIIHTKDLLAANKSPNESSITEFIRPILKVQTRLPVSNLLRRFREGMPHFALVYQDHQKLVGFITLDNVLQVLIGIIKDEFHQTHVDYKINKNGTITANGRCSIYALEQALDIYIETEESIETIEELVLHTMTTPLRQNECVHFDQFDICIDTIQNRRISQVTIIPTKSNPTAS